MSRFLLCLLLLPLATPAFAQVAVQFLASDGNLYGDIGDGFFFRYSPATGQKTILNSNAPPLTLCLEQSDGTLLAIGPGSSETWYAFDVTLAGVITQIAQFPGPTTEPACPAIANDGNYYGNSWLGGDYGKGYIYQLTAAGKIDVFYSFTGGPDGTGPTAPPVQASDGNLYWYYQNRLLRYSPSTGLTPTTLAYSGGFQTLLEASDGNFYAPGGGGVVQITPKGATTIIYAPSTRDDGAETDLIVNLYITGSAPYPLAALNEYSYTNSDGGDDCGITGNYFFLNALSLVGGSDGIYYSLGADEYNYGAGNGDGDDYSLGLVFGGNGNLYTAINDETYTDNGEQCGETDTGYNQTYAIPSIAPIAMSLSQTHVRPGSSAQLTWQVNNAYSDTLQQCYGFGGLSGKVALSGSATMSAPSAGSYVTSIVCGGTETGLATLVAGNATLALSSSATQVDQGTPVTLTVTVTNAGTPAPTGKVNFVVGSTVVGSASLVNGIAVLTASTASVPAGTYDVVASYAGDANYGPATSAAVSETVIGKTATSTTMTPATQTVLQGATVSITAKVAGASTHGSPTGSVQFLVGSTVVGTVALSSESSTASTAALTASTASVAPGIYPVMASYSGDNYNLPSNSASVMVAVKAGTPVTLAISPNPVPTDTSFTMTATVQGKDSPSGTVFFYVNSTQDLTSANVSGGMAQVTIPAGTLAVGNYQITAAYAGDANNPTGTSPAVSLTVQ